MGLQITKYRLYHYIIYMGLQLKYHLYHYIIYMGLQLTKYHLYHYIIYMGLQLPSTVYIITSYTRDYNSQKYRLYHCII